MVLSSENIAFKGTLALVSTVTKGGITVMPGYEMRTDFAVAVT